MRPRRCTPMTELNATDWMLLEELFEERAAILEYDAGFSRDEAEQRAAQMLGFPNKADLKNQLPK